ncbi:MAG: ribonuclease J [Dehalococcoidia bacterium]|nr:ribonuclease J [Dehalococcoidia bacterium]
MMIYEYDGTAIAVDVGLMFPEQEMLGVDIVIPEISYLVDRPGLLKAVFLTHGHEDHIGALPFLLRELNVPVYCTALTRGLVQVKLKEQRLLDSSDVQVVGYGDTVDVGPLSVEFFSVSHSIPDAAGVIIHTPLGPVVHTGDYKIDHTPVMEQHTDLNRLAELGSSGVLLLCADSTYAEVEGYTPSEQRVAETLERVIGAAQGRVVVTTFASLISRVQMVVDAAVKHGRRVFITGRSMLNNTQMARDMGYLKAPPGTFMTPREMNEAVDAKTVVICTGSQGEPSSALTRMANGTHQQIAIRKGDTVILSSNPVPGNEKLVSRNIDNLFELGAHVVYNRVADVHVRGHAAREELKITHRVVKPKYFVPIHGEFRHLVLHRELAIELGMPEENAIVLNDGDVLAIDEDSAEIVEKVPAEYVYVDGLGIGDVDEYVLRDRAHLASDGFVVLVVPVHRHSGRLARQPEVMTHGFVGLDEEASITQGVIDIVTDALGGEGAEVDWARIHESLKDDVAAFLREQTNRHPLVLPFVVAV